MDKPGIITKQLFHPLINTLVQALPFTYKNTGAIAGATLQLNITGEEGGEWQLQKTINEWQLSNEKTAEATATISMSADTAWKLFSKGISPAFALLQTEMGGDVELGKVALGRVLVMA